MVQIARRDPLESGDVLLPLTSLRDVLNRPNNYSYTPSKLLQILRYRLPCLRTPWQPFPASSSASRSAITGSSLSLPGTSLRFDIDDATRTLAVRLSERTRTDEIEALLLVKSYDKYSLDTVEAARVDEEEAKLDRLLLWYFAEVSAAAQILAILQREILATGQRASSSNDFIGDWSEFSYLVKKEVVGEKGEERFIEALFRAWCALAQRQLSEKEAADRPLLWASHQLRWQDNLLSLLFIVLYSLPYRSALISVGLVRGSIGSGFGAYQANRVYWEDDKDAQRTAERIRDTTLLIALESLCIFNSLSPTDEDDFRGEETLLRSGPDIATLDSFLAEESASLANPSQEPSEGALLTSPISLICMGWAVVLNSLPTHLQLSRSGRPAYVEMATRALRGSSGLFQWLDTILLGPLLTPSHDGDEPQNFEAHFRNIVKDLLVGIMQTVRLNEIPNRLLLVSAWNALFSEASPEVSQLLCEQFWNEDSLYEDRMAIIQMAHFPFNAVDAVRTLNALSATTSMDSGAGNRAAIRTATCFSTLSNPTFRAPSTVYRFIGKDDVGHLTVEATTNIGIPGGEIIVRGTRGTIVGQQEDTPHIISWQTSISGWALLLQLLCEATGATFSKPHNVPATSADCVQLSVHHLGIRSEPAEIISTGMTFLATVMSPMTGLASELVASLPGGSEGSVHSLIATTLAALELASSAHPTPGTIVAAPSALKLLGRLVVLPQHQPWSALRSSFLFSAPGKRKAIAARLVQRDSDRGAHETTLALVQFVLALVANRPSSQVADEDVLCSALQMLAAEIWVPHIGWRYDDPMKRFELTSRLNEVFETVLRHPKKATTSEWTTAAWQLVVNFVHSATSQMYRPIIEIVTQGPPHMIRLIATGKTGNARSVVTCIESCLTFLQTLLRIAHLLKNPINSLPTGMFAAFSPMKIGAKSALIDALFDLAISPSTQESTQLLVLRLLRTYFEIVGGNLNWPSLSGLLRDPTSTLVAVSAIATGPPSMPDTRAAAWDLLGLIISTQPGCALACIGDVTSSPDSPLRCAVNAIGRWEDMAIDTPQVLSALLNYLSAVLRSAASGTGPAQLRKDVHFWDMIFAISTYRVPTPPTFTLSMQSKDFEQRIQRYAYAVQAKAGAMSLSSTEVELIMNGEEEQIGSHAANLVTGMFRNDILLTETAMAALHSSCDPSLQAAQSKILQTCGVDYGMLQTLAGESERQYGRTYLYDGNPSIPGNDRAQAASSLAIDMLNLNWSMLDADVSLTKSTRALGEAASISSQDDKLAANAAFKASLSVADQVADESRGGDVMLAVQYERLELLTVLLSVALDGETFTPAQEDMSRLGVQVKAIIESQSFPPALTLRHPELPPIHRPVLRILLQFFQSVDWSNHDLALDSILAPTAEFCVGAINLLLDDIVRQGTTALSPGSNEANSAFDMSLSISALCELARSPSTSTWLDKLTEHGVFVQSCEAIVRARITNGFVPVHIPAVLLLHLALASNPESAEKLALSGVLSAYSDNAIALEAERGQITASSPKTVSNTPHGAWCGMLLVIKALLSSLEPRDMASFVRSDVLPFIRVCSPQLFKPFSWDGDVPISQANLEELELVCDVFLGISRSNVDVRGSLMGYIPASIRLLRTLREIFSHPNRSSALIVPVDEEEHAALTEEIDDIPEGEDPPLLDFAKAPILAGRTMTLLELASTVVFTLIELTKAWPVVQGAEDVGEDTIIPSDHENQSPSEDPIGTLIEIHSLVGSLSTRIPPSAYHTEQSTVITKLCLRISDACALLASAQYILRHNDLPERSRNASEMEVESDTKSPSMGMRQIATDSADGRMLYELKEDLRGILEGDGDGVMGGTLKGWLLGSWRGVLGRNDEE